MEFSGYLSQNFGKFWMYIWKLHKTYHISIYSYHLILLFTIKFLKRVTHDLWDALISLTLRGWILRIFFTLPASRARGLEDTEFSKWKFWYSGISFNSSPALYIDVDQKIRTQGLLIKENGTPILVNIPLL